MAEIEVYQRAWDDFLEAYGKVVGQNRKLIDLLCDFVDQCDAMKNNGYEEKELDKLTERYKELMNLDG